MTLGSVANISLGYSFRKGLTGVIVTNGNTSLLQAGDIQQGYFDTEGLVRVNSEDIRSEALLQKNDIVLSYRSGIGGTFRVLLIEDLGEKNILPTSSLAIIRIKAQGALPEYVATYLSSDQAQKDMQLLATGSTIRAIPLQALRQMEIVIPEIESQKALFGVWKNIQEQKKLFQKKIDLQEKMSNDLIRLSTQKI